MRETTKKIQVGNFIGEFYTEDSVPYFECRTTSGTVSIKVTADTPLYLVMDNLEWKDDITSLPNWMMLNIYHATQIWDAQYHADMAEALSAFIRRQEEEREVDSEREAEDMLAVKLGTMLDKVAEA